MTYLAEVHRVMDSIVPLNSNGDSHEYASRHGSLHINNIGIKSLLLTITNYAWYKVPDGGDRGSMGRGGHGCLSQARMRCESSQAKRRIDTKNQIQPV